MLALEGTLSNSTSHPWPGTRTPTRRRRDHPVDRRVFAVPRRQRRLAGGIVYEGNDRRR